MIQKRQFVLFENPTKQEKTEDIFYWYVSDDAYVILLGHTVGCKSLKTLQKSGDLEVVKFAQP